MIVKALTIKTEFNTNTETFCGKKINLLYLRPHGTALNSHR